MSSSAPAKIILCGEHAVVYGEPALAVPFTRLAATVSASAASPGSGLTIIAHDTGQRIAVTADEPGGLAYAARLILRELGQPLPDLTLDIRSTIPIGGGLGSGAAVTAALMRELGAWFGQSFSAEQLNPLVYEVETVYHGTPSGVDNTVIVYERPVYFVRGSTPVPLTIQQPLTLLVADSGVPGSTREAVAAVRHQFDTEPARIQPLLTQIGVIVSRVRAVLESDTANGAALGAYLNDNQAALQELGVSAPVLERLIDAARQSGALGAKLSGGGRGGNVIALVTAESAPVVTEALQQAGAVHVWQTVVT